MLSILLNHLNENITECFTIGNSYNVIINDHEINKDEINRFVSSITEEDIHLDSIVCVIDCINNRYTDEKDICHLIIDNYDSLKELYRVMIEIDADHYCLIYIQP
jgi:hypothetical protein